MMRIIGWWLFLILGFYLCSILTLIPIPADYQWFRPQWLLLFVLFCQIYHPSQFSLVIAWTVGLCLDALLGVQLGLHAFLFSFICYVASVLNPPFMQRSLLQQMGRILLLVALAQISLFVFHTFDGQNPRTLWYWMGSVTSFLVWPMFVIFLKGISLLLPVAPSPSRSI